VRDRPCRCLFIAVDSPLLFAWQRIAFAKGKSDAVARKDGSYVRDKRKGGGAAGGAAAKKTGVPPPPAPAAPMAIDEAAPGSEPAENAPHNVLLAANLPEECTETHLSVLFQQYNGFREIRLASGKGVAFVEFENEVQAGIALSGLKGFKLTPTIQMGLEYAKA